MGGLFKLSGMAFDAGVDKVLAEVKFDEIIKG